MSFRFLSLYLVAVFVVSGCILPGKTQAAASDILVNVAPENPNPGETVNITLSSYLYNLDSVSISWKVEGKTSASGIGQKTFSVTAPAAGSQTNVTATIALPDGAVTESAVIRSASMVLLWQADDSYTPPFYKGKALPSLGSSIKVVAMPEIRTAAGPANPNSLLYTWQQDYNNEPGASGYGKNFFTYTSDYLENSSDIGVTATTLDQNYSSNANVNIATYVPKILFYKIDLKLGTLWETALQNGHRVAGSEIIQAAPYFISPSDIRIPNLLWNWSINNLAIDAPQFAPNILTVQTQAGVSGTSTIDLTINSSDKIYETVSGEINVSF